jgi:hypothetical protein
MNFSRLLPAVSFCERDTPDTVDTRDTADTGDTADTADTPRTLNKPANISPLKFLFLPTTFNS